MYISVSLSVFLPCWRNNHRHPHPSTGLISRTTSSFCFSLVQRFLVLISFLLESISSSIGVGTYRASYLVLMHQVHIGFRECVTASLDVIALDVLVCDPPAVNDMNVRARISSLVNEHSFSCVGPSAWNSLPSSLQQLTDTKTFKRKLKTFLFQQELNFM